MLLQLPGLAGYMSADQAPRPCLSCFLGESTNNALVDELCLEKTMSEKNV